MFQQIANWYGGFNWSPIVAVNNLIQSERAESQQLALNATVVQKEEAAARSAQAKSFLPYLIIPLIIIFAVITIKKYAS